MSNSYEMPAPMKYCPYASHELAKNQKVPAKDRKIMVHTSKSIITKHFLIRGTREGR